MINLLLSNNIIKKQVHKINVVILCTCFYTNTFSQNLVPNPSFETFIECPDTSFLQFYTMLDSTWINFASPDYFNICDTSNYSSVPTNRFGYQYAHSGSAHAGLIAYYSSNFSREYIEIELISKLVFEETYYVQFYVNLADTREYAIENIGALFTDTLFNPYPFVGIWQTGVPQVENPSGNMLNDKINWVAINGSFVAQGGEQYMTIGNFKNDAQTVTQYFGGTAINTLGAYYYIDDVYVGTTPPVSINENDKNNFIFKLFPNPNNGNMVLEYSLADEKTGLITIFDVSGRAVSVFALQNGKQKQLFINQTELANGLYFYEIKTNATPLQKGKFVILK